MGHRGSETEFELTTITRLENLGYTYKAGEDLERPFEEGTPRIWREVVEKPVLRRFIAASNPALPDSAVDEAVAQFSRPDGVDTVRRNMDFHRKLIRGIEVKADYPDGRSEYWHLYAVDWANPENNEFSVVNQVTVTGQNERRLDIVIYINGLPLVVFELKNPYDERPTVEDAHTQITHYRHEIPQLFEYNAVTVVSDGVQTLHGMWSASLEWYAPWKTIDGFNIERNTTGSMKTLIEGLFPKDRLLQYIRSFILFECDDEKIIKKGAKYHQFFAVRLAAQKAVETVVAGKDKRIGVIWHTTGSGKSLSMAFLVGLLRPLPELDNPTIVVQVDRNDLDDQLYDQFVAAKSLVGTVQHADTVDDLREYLKTEGGEVIFSTIEKFRLKTEENETEHPVLSSRSNIIIIADEAHRSQYGFDKGYARYLSEALPNAHRIGFTGTPVSLAGADTVEVFGDLIHTYDIRQSQEDKATVPIYYEPRQIRLALNKKDVDSALKEITDSVEVAYVDQRKSQWAALASAAGAKDRIEELARDLLAHYTSRASTLDGKAMIVCMTRENCVRLYEALTALPGCPETKIVMTGNLGKDPEDWSKKNYLTTKKQRDIIKKRMIDPADKLKFVVVCDMWLTGTDIPCLHTLYIDKPMKGHNMIQAISRVNRVFKDKPHGLVVDYIGIGEELKEATNRYAKGGGKGDPAPDINDEAVAVFNECLDAVRNSLPEDKDYGSWRRMTSVECEDLYAYVYGTLIDDDKARTTFLEAEVRLTNAFILVRHIALCKKYADEVIFCQRVRKQLRKVEDRKKKQHRIDNAVRDLVDDAVDTEGVVDIFKVAGIEKPDISILDEKFLQTFHNRNENMNLRVELLHRLLEDKISAVFSRNAAQKKNFSDLLRDTIARYHNRIIDGAAVIKAIIEMKKQMEENEKRAQMLHLSEEELSFYDAISQNRNTIYDSDFLCSIVHDVVQVIKNNLKVDWTQPHREDVKAGIRSAIKRVLRTRNVTVEDFEPLIKSIMTQAESMYADWPGAA